MKTIRIPSNKELIKLQPLDSIPSCEYRIEDRAKVTILAYANTKKNIESEVHIRLLGEESQASIIGVFMCSEKQHITLHTLQQHEARNTTSNLLVKAVLSEYSEFFYDGAIRVEPAGQRTDAYQRNENLLLADSAHAESKPSLEILADDVRCTHGATMGDINKDQLYYLESRAIPSSEGKQLITQGFLEAALLTVNQGSEVDKVRQSIWHNL